MANPANQSAEAGWELFAEGMTFEWAFSVSDADMKAFGALSKDHHPLHTDPAFAARKGFPGPVVYGALLAGQVSRLIGEELPDENVMLTALSMEFMKPAHIGDALIFSAELTGKSDAAHSLRFKCRILREGVSICRGTADAIWRHDR